MKKIGFIIISLFVMFMVTGCGSSTSTKVLKCSGTTPGTNMNAASKVEFTFENDKISKSKIVVDFKDITVSNLSSVWEKFKEQFTEQNSPVEEEGFKRTVEADDENYIFSVIIEIDFNKITEETMKEYSVEDYRNKTYDEIRKETEKDTITCE